MIKIVVAYDDNDSALADYFEESYNNILQSIQSAQETPTVVLRGLDCTETNVNSAVVPLNPHPFLFVGLSHGNSEQLGIDSTGEIFVSNKNSFNFINSFFYTTACKVGKNLGGHLISNGCLVFVGYNDTSYAAFSEEHDQVFIDCELYIIKNFLNTNKSIEELFNDMLAYTEEQIDNLTTKGDIVDAMLLQYNKNCIILLGDGKLTKNSFQTVQS